MYYMCNMDWDMWNSDLPSTNECIKFKKNQNVNLHIHTKKNYGEYLGAVPS